MQQHIKPLLIGLAVSVVIFAVSFLVLQFAVSSASTDEVGEWAIYFYFAWAMLMLFLPSFAAGYVARNRGMIYGLILASLPLGLWPIVNRGFPTVLYIPWFAVAAVGGYCGQIMGQRKHAS